MKREKDVEKERKTKMVKMGPALKVFALVGCMLALIGCRNKGKEKSLTARAEAAEVALTQAKAQLTKAEAEVASLKEELGAAKSIVTTCRSRLSN